MPIDPTLRRRLTPADRCCWTRATTRRHLGAVVVVVAAARGLEEEEEGAKV
jgi:hypothetical protein